MLAGIPSQEAAKTHIVSETGFREFVLAQKTSQKPLQEFAPAFHGALNGQQAVENRSSERSKKKNKSCICRQPFFKALRNLAAGFQDFSKPARTHASRFVQNFRPSSRLDGHPRALVGISLDAKRPGGHEKEGMDFFLAGGNPNNWSVSCFCFCCPRFPEGESTSSAPIALRSA